MPDSALPGERVIKRFRVAREGQTVDGRLLSQQQITDMADTYNPVEYAARINCEHMRDWWAGLKSGDGALGDVISVDAEMTTFTQNGSEIQLLCLYATLSALPILVDANKEGRKLYTSIEFYPKFAGTDRAYLVGLAVTDTPASLGTEPLKFSRRNDALTTDADQELTLMTQNTPTPVQSNSAVQVNQPLPLADLNTPQPVNSVPAPVIMADESQVNKEDGFLSKLTTMFSKKTGLSDKEKDGILEGFTAINDHLEESDTNYSALSASYTELKTELDALKVQLGQQPATNLTLIPVSTGAGAELTDY